MTLSEGYVGPGVWRRALVAHLGEFAREAAVLIAVFVPLDLTLVGALTGRTIVATVMAVTVLFSAAVYLETKR